MNRNRLSAAVPAGTTARTTVPCGAQTGEFRRQAEMVCELVQTAARMDLHQKPGPQLAAMIQTIFDVEAVAVFDADMNEIYSAGQWHSDPEQAVRNICVFGTVRDDPETGLISRVLQAGEMPVGSLLLRGSLEETIGNTIASLAAISFDRYHSLANEMRMESEKRAEQLRSAVLDNLAHAYKTPLTAIRVASSGLAEMDGLSAAQRDLVTLIEEQAELLNGLTTRLLRTARLENQTLRCEAVAIAALIEDAVAELRDQLAGCPILVNVEPEGLTVRGDRNLLRAMLTHFLENAGKYGDAGSAITIQAMEKAEAVVLSVHNFGPAIPAADWERIFDRYFRCTATEGLAPGTGIGLSVARQAAVAHGGDIWVTSDPVRGTTFFASLPNTSRGVEA